MTDGGFYGGVVYMLVCGGSDNVILVYIWDCFLFFIIIIPYVILVCRHERRFKRCECEWLSQIIITATTTLMLFSDVSSSFMKDMIYVNLEIH